LGVQGQSWECVTCGYINCWAKNAGLRANNPLARIATVVILRRKTDAGWSSLAARRAHNPKVGPEHLESN